MPTTTETTSEGSSPTPTPDHVDVLIVGAGLSGIGAAYRLQQLCPGHTYAVLEGRDDLGGTWDLFRYPGVRSDSDMYTLGYPFKPWTGRRAIAEGADILAYIRETAEENGIVDHIRFGHRVTAASWSDARARWTVIAEVGRQRRKVTVTCSFLYLCSGYYSYESGHTPELPGIDDFQGRVVHPQEWPEDLDHEGRRVVVIGSGATAVTLVPSMAATAEHVTMLQRSPTYIATLPAEDPLAALTRRILPERIAHQVNRWRSVVFTSAFYQLCRRAPRLARRMLRAQVRAQLPPDHPIDPDFSPSYDPWDQRLCLVPDGDLFAAIRRGRASIVTGHIDTFTETGIRLTDGSELEADIVVTATGLRLVPAGGISVDVDGEHVEMGDRFVYKGHMLNGVPNAAMCVGYTNASWTLRADITSRAVCRLLDHMARNGHTKAVAEVDESSLEPRPLLDLSSGYVRRAADLMPKQGSREPWVLRQNFILDLLSFRFRRPFEDIRFSSPDRAARRPGSDRERELVEA